MADQKLRVILEAKSDKLVKALEKSSNKLQQFGKDATRIGKNLSVGLTLPIAAAGGAAIKLASDFEESLNKVDVSFKKSSESVKEFSKTTLTQFGIAQGTALDMAAMFGDMGTSMGLTTDQAAKMSTSMVGLAGDLASFKNIKIEEATTALAAVFTGETESLKRLGIVMTEANLKQFALTQGITKNIKAMTQAEKTTLRYQYVIASTGNAQGDFARTQGGAANQMRIFTESLKEIGANLGQILLPAFTKMVTKVNELLKAFMGLDEGTKKTILVITGIVAAVGPFLMALGKLPGLLSLAAGGFRVLTAAMIANPILAVATAIAAVTVALVQYRKSQKEANKVALEQMDAAQLGEKIEALEKRKQSLYKRGYEDGQFRVQQVQDEIDVYKKQLVVVNEAIKANEDLEKQKNKTAAAPIQPAAGPVRQQATGVSALGATAGTAMGTTQQLNLQAGSSLLGEMQTVTTDPVAMLAASVSNSSKELDGALQRSNSILKARGIEQQLIAQENALAVGEIVTGGLQGVAEGIGMALGEAIANGGSLIGALSSTLLTGLANMAIQMGKLVLQNGIAIEAIKESLTKLTGIPAIVAGVALIAIGAAVKAGAANIAKGKGKGGGGATASGPRTGAIAAFANGGIVSGPTLGLMGEYAGARSNPEVIAPLDKLKNLIGDRQAQQVNVGGQFELRGQDLIVALQRAEKQRGRIK
jgi:hypothetical protein